MQKTQYRPLIIKNANKNTPFFRVDYKQTIAQLKSDTIIIAFKTIITDKAKGAEVVKTNILSKKTRPRYPCRVCKGNYYNFFHRNK